MLKIISLYLIAFYQKHISAKKGFSCAYRVHTGGMGCSGYGRRAIEKHGFLLGISLLRRRLAKCAWQSHQHAPLAVGASGRNVRMRGQGGFVDCDCTGCGDLHGCDMLSCDTSAQALDFCTGSVFPDWAYPLSYLSCDGCSTSGYSRESKRLRDIEERRNAAAAQYEAEQEREQ